MSTTQLHYTTYNLPVTIRYNYNLPVKDSSYSCDFYTVKHFYQAKFQRCFVRGGGSWASTNLLDVMEIFFSHVQEPVKPTVLPAFAKTGSAFKTCMASISFRMVPDATGTRFRSHLEVQNIMTLQISLFWLTDINIHERSSLLNIGSLRPCKCLIHTSS